jgi:hypothetical protein
MKTHTARFEGVQGLWRHMGQFAVKSLVLARQQIAMRRFSGNLKQLFYIPGEFNSFI